MPGGKIEHEESPKKTLIRELAEELGITVPIESLTYVTTVIGPSLRWQRSGDTDLFCRGYPQFLQTLG
ncbi:MAG: NUDIX domain-containing protein [Rhodospirillaceae bacterium]|nr:NUDIX domain-containing protein [Rhodospirillaceae bacterium]